MSDQLDRLKAALAADYVVESELGRGGMATVYLARDLKHERQVAIKVLHPELALVGYHPERFLREVRIVASLTHPNILPLHDSGERGGFLYYIMPFIADGSLRGALDSRRHRVEEVVQIGRAVAVALDYAHRRDVLHRDIKPENILFSEGQPLVADFGVARAISACCDDITEIGIAIGSPVYMSPEQAMAEQELDGRSDQYSLACVLYEMLAGRPPFSGPNARSIMAKHAASAAEPVRAANPEVPTEVERALAKALAKEPGDRFATAFEFAEALSEAVSGGTRAVTPETCRTFAVLPFVNASPDPENEYFSDGITDELINALAQVEGLDVASRTSVFALKGGSRDVRSIGSLLGVSTILDGTVRKAGNRLRITAQLSDTSDGRLIWSERYDREVEDVFALQDEITSTIVQTLRATILGDLGEPTSQRYAGNFKAYNLYLQGRYYWNQRTGEGILHAIECFEQAIAEDPEYAPAYSGLADCHAIQVDYRGIPAAEGMERAKAEARKAIELDDTLAEAHSSLAWVTFIYDWDWGGSEREFRRAIELNPRYATARQWNSWRLMALGHVDEALAEGHAALNLDPASVSIRRAMGWLYYYAGQYRSAVQHLRRALEMDPTAYETHRVLGLTHLLDGDLDAAETELRQAMAPPGKSTAYAMAAFAYLMARRGNRAEAEAMLRELYALAREKYVSPVAFATAHSGLEQADETLAWLEKAREERRGWLAYLKVEPLLKWLRGDPRFGELLGRMRLG
jgi:serine/threonine-protein kinase